MNTYSNTLYQLKKLIESINVSKYTNIELEGNLSDYIKNAKEFTELSFNLLYKRDYDGQPVYSNKTINSGLEFEYKNQKNISTKEIIFKVGKAATAVDSKGNKNKIGFGGAHIADKHANDLDFMFRKLLNSSDKEIRKIINYINQISNSMNFITNEERKMFRILMWFPFALKNGQQGTKENDKNKNIDNKTYILYENSFFVLELTSSKTAFSLTTVYPASKSTKNNFKEYKPTNESLEIKQLYENAGIIYNNNGEFSMSSDNIYESRVNKNLKESLEFHSKLNNKIWNGFKLKEKVHDALYKIADVFTRSLEVPNLELEDVVITGSLCNYNYNKNSDIDLHLVVDFEKLGITPEDFVQKYFNAKKTEFNTKHDIKVYGYPVELYVEDVKSPARATGRYSLLDNQWINTPKGMKDEVVDISDNKKYKEFVDKIDSLEDDDASLEHASDLLSEIYDMRASGLEKDGELSEDNLVFKELRNGGYLDKLREYMIDTMDDELSLTESYKRR